VDGVKYHDGSDLVVSSASKMSSSHLERGGKGLYEEFDAPCIFLVSEVVPRLGT
jgi:hypothetical protein